MLKCVSDEGSARRPKGKSTAIRLSHKETDKSKQASKMQHFGEVLTDIVMPDLQTSETESSLEINFFIGKLKHTVKRVRKENGDK